MRRIVTAPVDGRAGESRRRAPRRVTWTLPGCPPEGRADGPHFWSIARAIYGGGMLAHDPGLSTGDPVLDAARDAVITTDDRGTIVELNRAAERVFGFTRSEALGRRVGDLLVPEPQRAAYEAVLRRIAAGGDAHVMGRRLRLCAQRSDGREIVIVLFVTRTSDAPPRFTAWIREPHEPEDAGDEPSPGEAQEAPPAVGSWTWTPSQSSLSWSENVYRILGLRPGDVAPDPQVIVDLAHPDDRELVRSKQREAKIAGELPPVAYRIVRPDGRVRHLRTVLAVAERRDGEPYRLVGFVEDHTERVRARRADAARAAATRAIGAWATFEQGAQGLLAGLAAALECHSGVVWLPRNDGLVARTVWRDRTADATLPDPVRRGTRLRRTNDPAWRACARRAVARAPYAVAIPAGVGRDVLALVELRSRERLEISAPLMRALAGIGDELGRFLDTRRNELDIALLTPRELDVLGLATRGLKAKQIAGHLAISHATVRTHFENLYPKLGVSDRAAAVAAAIRLGLIG
jgi:PAS domain S-box-containing protein